MSDLFAVVMLSGIYSLLSASLFLDLDAVDVAFTEASVGAGISTLLFLATLKLVPRYEKKSRYKPTLALGVVIATGALLIYGTLDMPHFGEADAPVHQHVAPRYLNDSMNEVGIPNVVTSVLASYRGYDTLGETLVVFTAGIGVLSLLMVSRRTKEKALQKVPADMQNQIILRVVAKMMLPLILIFALYVQFHGDYGPGGGFQAGVIFAAGIILYTMLFGLSLTQKVIKTEVVERLTAFGVLLYAGVGIACMLLGGNFLDYNVLRHDPVHGQHLGILLVELGVGITVAAVMVTLFFKFTWRTVKHKYNQ
ncbi:MAG: cation:proton antiporter [Desulfobulbaceae bacterium S3730MH12]|nr:MAG: cation:proton antiporter [Desulfobulbaceae bacterium S5133MH15]OEU58322.1 MAG: cation:proton antiporter [Desulfobulbaceae bacterium S3730MH12]